MSMVEQNQTKPEVLKGNEPSGQKESMSDLIDLDVNTGLDLANLRTKSGPSVADGIDAELNHALTQGRTMSDDVDRDVNKALAKPEKKS